MRMLIRVLFISVILIVGCIQVDEAAFSNVRHEDGKTYIIDRTGERWDVTLAVTLGFKPEEFQYGIGKDIFTPLDDSLLTDSSPELPKNMRVIGIGAGNYSKAYSVSRLGRHEISNSALGDKPVAVGY